MKKRLGNVVFLLLLVVVISGCNLWTDSPVPSPSNSPIPPEDGGIRFTLPDLAGNEVDFWNFRGKPVVVFFFKSYCPHCQDEAWFLQSVYRKYQEKVQFLGIAVNEQGTSGILIASTFAYAQQVYREFVAAHGWTFPVLVDDYGQVQRQLVGTGVPSFVFVDANGVIQGAVKDTLSQSKLEQLISVYLLD